MHHSCGQAQKGVLLDPVEVEMPRDDPAPDAAARNPASAPAGPSIRR